MLNEPDSPNTPHERYEPPRWVATIARIARERQFPDILDGPEVEEAWREGVQSLLGRSPTESP